MTDAVEAVARAIRRGQFERTRIAKHMDPDLPPTENELSDAQAAITAYRDWLAENGPDEEMVEAGANACVGFDLGTRPITELVTIVFKAMIEASGESLAKFWEGEDG